MPFHSCWALSWHLSDHTWRIMSKFGFFGIRKTLTYWHKSSKGPPGPWSTWCMSRGQENSASSLRAQPGEVLRETLLLLTATQPKETEMELDSSPRCTSTEWRQKETKNYGVRGKMRNSNIFKRIFTMRVLESWKWGCGSSVLGGSRLV